MRLSRLAWTSSALMSLALLSGCDGTISVTFFTGAQVLEVSAASFSLPSDLEDESGNIARVPCGPTGMCPPSSDIAITCEADVCDPAPITLSAPVGGVVDVEMLLAETREVGVRSIESYSIDAVEYAVQRNTLPLDVGPIEVYWGPDSATSINPALGVRPFGTLPVLRAETTPEGAMELDDEGVAALSEHLVDTGTRVRFFAKTTVDLEPGDPFPEGGNLEVGVNLTVTAVGRVL